MGRRTQREEGFRSQTNPLANNLGQVLIQAIELSIESSLIFIATVSGQLVRS
jgi:hypothetical protein